MSEMRVHAHQRRPRDRIFLPKLNESNGSYFAPLFDTFFVATAFTLPINSSLEERSDDAIFVRLILLPWNSQDLIPMICDIVY